MASNDAIPTFTPAEYVVNEHRQFLGYDWRHRKYYSPPELDIRFIAPPGVVLPCLGDYVTLDLGADGRFEFAVITGLAPRRDPGKEPAIEVCAWTRPPV